ncbi:MAG TPA: STAS domain-containing protein [Panacibacter sp.]|nr:STAS domain-containing protein [Panacibacter sp.]
MNFKIDTKEKFTTITPMQIVLSDNLTAELDRLANDCLQSDIKNVILNLQHVESIDEPAAEKLATLQQTFYENSASFVICQVNQPVEVQLDQFQLLETMNLTPSESEAWDIVQMEEIERELMDDFDEE